MQKTALKYMICLFGACYATLAHSQDHWKRANALCSQEAYASCLAALDSCTGCPADSALYLRAYISIKQNRLKDAQAYCRQLQRLNKNYDEAMFLKGLICSVNGDYVEAAEQFTKVINKNSHHVKALYNRALVKGLLEDYDGAITDLDTCIAVAPGYAAAYYSRGYWCESALRYDRALADYNASIALDPQFKEAYLALAYVLNLKGERQKACETLDLAIEKGSTAAMDLKDNYCK